MNEIKNPHDKYFRTCMNNLRIAKDFFSAHLPKEIAPLVDLDTLNVEPNSFISEDLSQRISDVLYSVNIKDNPGYLYILTEHQSTPDEWMPLRILHYLCRIMESHVGKAKEKSLPIIVPLVFYHGRQTPYPYSTDIFDLFKEGDQDLARQCLFQPFHLVDVTQISDEQLKQRLWSGVMEFMQKHIFERDVLRYFESIMPGLRQLKTLDEKTYIIETVNYLFGAAEHVDLAAAAAFFNDQVNRDIGGEAMTLAEQLRAEGEARGEARGESRGESKVKQQVANQLLNEGSPLDLISRVTGFTLKEVSALQAKEAELA